jgi:hypothetical protein
LAAKENSSAPNEFESLGGVKIAAIGGYFLKRHAQKRNVSELLDILDDFLEVADMLLNLALSLVLQTLCLLVFVANQFAGLFLNFSGDVFYSALDLIFVHIEFHIDEIEADARIEFDSACGSHNQFIVSMSQDYGQVH